jgi:hypothetical protein
MSQAGHMQQGDCISALDGYTEEARQKALWEPYLTGIEKRIRIMERAGDVAGIRATLHSLGTVPAHSEPRLQCLAKSISALDLLFGGGATAVADAEEAARLAESHGLRDLIDRTEYRLYVCLVLTGELYRRAGARALERFLDIGDRTGDLAYKVNCPNTAAVWMMDIGEVDQADAFCQRALAARGATDGDELISRVLINLGDIAIARGDYESGFAHYHRVLVSPSNGGAVAKMTAQGGAGLCALRVGHLTEARRIDADLKWDGDVYFDCTIVTWFKVEMAKTRGELKKGLEFLDAVLCRAANSGWRLTWMKLLLLQIDYLTRVDPERAGVLAQQGLERAIDLGLGTRVTQFRARLYALRNR